MENYETIDCLEDLRKKFLADDIDLDELYEEGTLIFEMALLAMRLEKFEMKRSEKIETDLDFITENLLAEEDEKIFYNEWLQRKISEKKFYFFMP